LLAIGGLSLAAVQGGLFGGNCNSGGGLLGGLFGGNSQTCEQLARGRQAETELAVINQYLMPTWAELCNLKQEVAVNKAIEQKNHEITGLLFKRAEENTAAGFELNKMRTESAFALARQEQQCCCDKANARIDYVSALQAQKTDAAFDLASQKTDSNFALLDQKTNANFRQLSSDTDCAYKRLDSKIDGAFIINNLETDAKICDSTKYMVKGNVYLSPKSMADPYEAGTNILMSRHVYPAYSSGWTNWGSCGCAGAAGVANGFGW